MSHTSSHASSDAATTQLPAEFLSIDTESREKVRRTLKHLEREGRRVSVRSVRNLANVSQRAAGVLTRLWKQGVLPPINGRWDYVPPPAAAENEPTPIKSPESSRVSSRESRSELGSDRPTDPLERKVWLDRLITAAETSGDRAQALQEIAAAVVAGALDASAGRLATAALSETRQQDKDHRANTPDEDPDRIVLAGPEAYQIVRLYQGMISRKKQEAVIRYIVRQAKADLEESPVIDEAADGVGKE